MLNDWSHKVRAILENIARAILKKDCPPCHKAHGIHDFILATKSSVWIIIIMFISILIHRLQFYVITR